MIPSRNCRQREIWRGGHGMLSPYSLILYCGVSGGKEELQERGDALGPGGFVVLRAGEDFKMEVAIFLPAFLQERVAESGDLFNGARDAFVGADIEPDARSLRQFCARDRLENDAVIPPYGRGEDRELAENLRIFQAKIDSEETAER